jgi:glycosyltransferase involved in cell wall biosynthesis
MKIHVFVGNTRFTGGRQELFRHANALARRGHEVTVWTQANPRIDWLEMEVPVRALARSAWHDVPPGDVCIFERPRLAHPLWRAGRGIPVHFCQGFEQTDVENRLRALLAERGLLRRLPQLWRLWRRQRKIERAYGLPTVKIAVHQHLREVLARRYNQAAYFVPCGLPTGVFTPPAERTFHGLNVLVVGPTDTRWKRVTDALEAVRLLKRTRSGVRLLRVAPHPMRDAERALAITDEYHTMLKPPGMAELYRRADVLAVASDATEGFGLPVLEAMACGTPVVLTDVPSFRAFARPTDYAHFVPVANPVEMARALGRLLDDPAERARLSRRGLEVASGYTLERSQQAMANVLADIVARERPAI